jgi:hypothetical protein
MFVDSDQSIFGLSFSYSQSKNLSSRGLDLGYSKNGIFAVGAFVGYSSPSRARIFGFGFDAKVIVPNTKSPLGCSVLGAFARASIAETSSSSVFSLALQPFVRFSGKTVEVIPNAQISGALGSSKHSGDKFAVGASLGVDIVFYPIRQAGISLGVAVTSAAGENGFAVSIATLFPGRRAP